MKGNMEPTDHVLDPSDGHSMDSIETNDAMLRYHEGGGQIPHEWQLAFSGVKPGAAGNMSGLAAGAAPGAGAAGPWYTSPVFMVIVGVGLLATGIVVMDAMKKKEHPDAL